MAAGRIVNPVKQVDVLSRMGGAGGVVEAPIARGAQKYAAATTRIGQWRCLKEWRWESI